MRNVFLVVFIAITEQRSLACSGRSRDQTQYIGYEDFGDEDGALFPRKTR